MTRRDRLMERYYITRFNTRAIWNQQVQWMRRPGHRAATLAVLAAAGLPLALQVIQ